MTIFAPIPSPTNEMILIALQELGDVIDDELNALWAAQSRPWYRRFRAPDRDALYDRATVQRIAHERAS